MMPAFTHVPGARLGGEEDRERPEAERAEQAHDVVEELRAAAHQATAAWGICTCMSQGGGRAGSSAASSVVRTT